MYLTWVLANSKGIDSFAYDAVDAKLYVVFVSSPHKIYVYHEVPVSVYESMCGIVEGTIEGSIGKFVHSDVVRKGYEFTIEQDDD